ncbi:MAG: HPr family phosphocarrier protein [Clostridia bacterium]|nr:HPr family phosphocarrier protein [Clostridia bacterium]
MKSFTYVIKDSAGIHARPAGLLSKLAKEFSSEILVEKDKKNVNATRLMMLMGLGIKCGDTVTVTVSGEDEDAALDRIQAFFRENL